MSMTELEMLLWDLEDRSLLKMRYTDAEIRSLYQDILKHKEIGPEHRTRAEDIIRKYRPHLLNPTS
jgi:hypothetical protein